MDAPRLIAGEPTLALLARADHGRTPPHSGGAHSSTTRLVMPAVLSQTTCGLQVTRLAE